MTKISTIQEGELKDRLKAGEPFTLLLEYDPNVSMFSLNAEGPENIYQIQTFRGGVRMMRDPLRAMSWASRIGLKGIKMDITFA